MIPAWLDLRSFILGMLAAYTLSVLLAVAWCWLRDFADQFGRKRLRSLDLFHVSAEIKARQRGREEQRRIEQFERRQVASDTTAAKILIDLVAYEPPADVTECLYHHVEVFRDEG
jgi:hypothetical protein